MKNKNIFSFLFSTRLMSIAILAYAIAMAAATFIENDFGTPTSKAVVYNTWWFELIMGILVLNFFGNMFKYRLFRREKWPVLLFHISFIVTLLGAFITRYYGFEGKMLIREGAVSNVILLETNFIDVRVDNSKVMKHYNEEVLFGKIGRNHYNLTKNFGETDDKIPFSVSLIDYIANYKQTLVNDEQGETYLHLVETSSGSRDDIYIKNGEIKNIDGILFTFNDPVPGGMNFTTENGTHFFQPIFNGTFMEMKSQKLTNVVKDSIAPLQLKKLYTFNDKRFVIKAITKGKLLKETAKKSEQENFGYDLLRLKIKSGDAEKIVEVEGAQYAIIKPKKVSLNGLNFNITYGSKEVKTPFSIKLKDFELKRYPGTNSPSSYASEVTLIDKDETYDYRIFMNHVLDHKGYRFFQSSYYPDEKGTHLAVNHDYWGTIITYLGYLLMGIGMFFTLFWKGSRFKDLSDKLRKISAKKTMLILLLLSFGFVNAQDNNNHNDTHATDKTVGKVDLSKISISKKHASEFGKLLIQDHQGRVKPINTYALEVLRKVYQKDSYRDLSAEQVLLSAQLYPKLWSGEQIVKVKSTPLGRKISTDLKVEDDYTNMQAFFKNGAYYLEKIVAKSFQKNTTLQNATDKEIIKLDDRANVWWNVLNGSLMTIYPKNGAENNKWYLGTDEKVFVGQDSMVIKMNNLYFSSLNKAIMTNDYKDADMYLKVIKDYQYKLGSSIIPSDIKIDLEIKYNRWKIFFKLLIFYFTIGFILLVLAFIDLFKPNSKDVKKALKIFEWLSVIGFVAHLIGLGIRWYVSGHAPWSNGYEAIVFISSITVLAGLIFSKNRSKFIIAVAVLFAAFLLGIAHGSLMNPEITNLVPVLKSYWLMIHVAVITASYAFLSLAALLGFIVLLLFILRSKSNYKRFNETIKELTYVNESAMIVGLFMLSVGTFLGGVWANESWGRYWGWDPKEVWALISMMVYIFILHMRMVPGLQSRFAFNFTSMISISTLIMTYFGVNYYLSGKHSYATGDPVPFPNWAYFAIAFFVLFSIFSYVKYKKFNNQ